MVQDYQETQPPSDKEVIDTMLALMQYICEPCEDYPTCTLDPPKECISFKKATKLWAYNDRCSECGKLLENHNIKACETGLSYCSHECAKTHVNRLEGPF